MKKVILILAAAFFAAQFQASAQRDYFKPVRLSINSESGCFAKGDTVKIYANLVEDVNVPLRMKIYENGGVRHYSAFKKKPETRPLELGKEPQLIFSGVYNEAYTAMISVEPVEKGNKDRAMVGFGVAVDEFRPGYAEPDDFVKYWDAQKKALRKSKMKVKKTEVDSGNPDVVAWAIELSMPEGNPVRGFLAMPKNAVKKSLPIILSVHSAGVNRKGCASNLKKTVSNAKCGNGAIAIDINAHGMLDGQPQSYYDDLMKNELKSYQSRPLTEREDFYFRLMYLREVRTMDFACNLPEWDGKRALVYGGSQGGGQSLAIAGLDSRITAACVNVPAMTDLGGSTLDRQNGWPGYATDALTEKGRSILPYFDGAIFAQHTKAKIIMGAGFVDETCYAGCVLSAFNACPSEDKVLFTSPYRWHSGSAKPYESYYKFYKAEEEFMKEFCK